MKGILYFTSTGNSLYIAQKIQEKTAGRILYIPRYEGNCNEFEQIIIVSPIYSFGLPVHVYDLMPKIDKSVPISFVLNYGGMVGGADYFTYQYAKGLGLNVQSVYTVKMPENFTLYFTVPQPFLNSVLKAAPKNVEKITDKITKGEFVIPKKVKTKEAKYTENRGNWHKIGSGFSVNENCVLCEKCISLCPVQNISQKEGKITFSDKCVACLGCYHRCPRKAITYKNKKKKFRYVNPYINESDIGKDF